MSDNPFRTFWAAGYKRLVPIVPPGASVSEKSSFARRPGALGKAPGVKGEDGLWRGVNWLALEATEESLDHWHAMGAGVGIRTGGGIVAVDIDTMDPELALKCHNMAHEALGVTPPRIGRPPKKLLLYRVSEPVPYQRVIFDDGLPCKPGAEPRVELLSEDRQFVASGIHPVTGHPYKWPCGKPDLNSLPIVTPAQINAYFAWLATVLPAARTETIAASADRSIEQSQLAGDIETVRRAVAALPNTTRLFPGYDDYVRVGYAIKGATQDDPETGLELFQEWAAKWEGGNDPDVVAADWGRCKPPFQVGAQYLYSLAEEHSGGAFKRAEAWFDDADAPSANPFDQTPLAASAGPALEPIRWIDPDTWVGKEPPPREWEVEGWIPRRQVTLLYGEGGIGKTLLIHQYGICAAAGLPWLGQPTRQARVMAVFCEDDEDELQRRHHDLMRALGVKPEDLGGRFRFVSRTGEDNLLAVANRASGALQPTPFYRQMLDDALAWRADVTITDTIADAFGGSEIDRGHVNAFVKMILGGIVKATRGSVIALGHPSVAGRAEGRSGSTAWSNAARSRIYLRYPDKEKSGNRRELEGMKLNYGPAGNLLKLKWHRGAFDVTAERKQPIDENPLKSAEAVAVALPSVESVAQRAVLAAIAAAQADGVALNLKLRSSAYAPKVLKRTYPEHLDSVRIDEIEPAIVALEHAGLIAATERKDPANRNTVSGFSVTVSAVVAPAAPGVFD